MTGVSDKTQVPSDGTNAPVAITGCPVEPDKTPPVRMELRQMKAKKPDQFNLYLIALERFKNVDERKPLSFFKIAGIHGLPHEIWPDGGWNKMPQLRKNRGFCTHSSILFLTWHRPYLALFEAELYKLVQQVAQDFPEDPLRNKYVEAARDFRMPYWDWALPDTTGLGLFPQEALGSYKHDLVRPPRQSDQPEIPKEDNPLAYYEFRNVGRGNTSIDWYPKTHRTARHSWSVNPEQDLQDKVRAFEQQQPDYYKGKNLTERTLYILQSYDKFAPMSHNKWSAELAGSVDELGNPLDNMGSLEDVHNSVHTYVGGAHTDKAGNYVSEGHMAAPAVAAFDPIFWLHHTNIDRLFAIWQSLHDDSEKEETYVTERNVKEPTFSTPLDPQPKENIKTPLTPFTITEDPNATDKYWKSDGVRKTSTFGYMYPETVLGSKEQIRARIADLYKNGSLANLAAASSIIKSEAIEELKPRVQSHVMVADTSNPVGTGIIVQAIEKQDSQSIQAIASEAAKVQLPKGRAVEDLIVNNKYLEWLVNVKAAKHSLGGNYFVHFFLGNPGDDRPDLYVANPTHVASFSTFGSSETTACEKCKEDQAENLEVSGQIPLTMALAERYLAGHVDSLGVEDVTRFLKEHLHWRVTSIAGVPRARSEVDGLRVSVVTNEVTLPTDSSGFPRYAPHVVPRPQVTMNRDNDPRGDGTGYDGNNLATGA